MTEAQVIEVIKKIEKSLDEGWSWSKAVSMVRKNHSPYYFVDVIAHPMYAELKKKIPTKQWRFK